MFNMSGFLFKWEVFGTTDTAFSGNDDLFKVLEKSTKTSQMPKLKMYVPDRRGERYHFKTADHYYTSTTHIRGQFIE